jgi:1-pyrroline-5-carboxylate dehydrogenase
LPFILSPLFPYFIMNAILQLPPAHNEPVYVYAPGSPERAALEAALKALRAEQREVPCYVGAERIFTGNTQPLRPPHDHRHQLGVVHRGDASLVSKAIDEALMAKATSSPGPTAPR